MEYPRSKIPIRLPRSESILRKLAFLPNKLPQNLAQVGNTESKPIHMSLGLLICSGMLLNPLQFETLAAEISKDPDPLDDFEKEDNMDGLDDDEEAEETGEYGAAALYGSAATTGYRVTLEGKQTAENVNKQLKM